MVDENLKERRDARIAGGQIGIFIDNKNQTLLLSDLKGSGECVTNRVCRWLRRHQAKGWVDFRKGLVEQANVVANSCFERREKANYWLIGDKGSEQACLADAAASIDNGKLKRIAGVGGIELAQLALSPNKRRHLHHLHIDKV